jgi:hypothetical protein
MRQIEQGKFPTMTEYGGVHPLQMWRKYGTANGDIPEVKETHAGIAQDQTLRMHTRTKTMHDSNTTEMALAIRRFMMTIWYFCCTQYDVPGKINVPMPPARASPHGDVQYAPRNVV